MEEITLEGLEHVNDCLKKASDFAETAGMAEDRHHPFTCTIGEGSLVEIDIETPVGKIQLGDYLPGRLNIWHEEGLGPYMYVEAQWTKNGSLIQKSIHLDAEWLGGAGVKGIAGLAHEIGHCFEDNGETVMTGPGLQIIGEMAFPERPTKSEDLKEYLRGACEAIGKYLKDEVEAYNYGKAIASLFGVSGLDYENMMDLAIRTYSNDAFLQLKEEIETTVAELGNQLNTDGLDELSLYDLSAQEERKISYRELMKFLGGYSQERTDRDLKNAHSAFGFGKE